MSRSGVEPSSESIEIVLRPIANAIAGIYQTYLSFDDAVDRTSQESPLQLLRNELKKLPKDMNESLIGKLIEAQVTHIGKFEVSINPGEEFPRLLFYVSDVAEGEEALKAYFFNQWRLCDVPASTEVAAVTVVEANTRSMDEAAMAEAARQSMLAVTASLGGTPNGIESKVSVITAVEAAENSDRIVRGETAEQRMSVALSSSGGVPDPVLNAHEEATRVRTEETVARQSALRHVSLARQRALRHVSFFGVSPVPQVVSSHHCVVVKSTLQENPEVAIKNSLYVQSALAVHSSISVVVLVCDGGEKAARQFSVTKDARGNLIIQNKGQEEINGFRREGQFLVEHPGLAEKVKQFVFSKVKANFQMEEADADIAIPIIFSEMFHVFSAVVPDAASEVAYKLSLINSPHGQVKALLQKRFNEKLPLDQLILDLEARKASYEDRIRRGKQFHFGHLCNRTEARSANNKQDAVSHILAAAICLKEGRCAAAEVRLFKECDAVKEGRLKGLFDRFNQIAERAEYRSLLTSAPTLG